MYGNLMIAMKQRKVTQAKIARLLNMSGQGIYKKLHTGNFDMSEAVLIQEKWFADYDLKELFKRS